MKLSSGLRAAACIWLQLQWMSRVTQGSELSDMIDDFECFEDKKKNYFANEPYAEITNLPQVRLMMCGYESQCALQFAAYLFMREKLGINVTFYPTLDYDDIWSGEHWNWSATLAYPRKYFEWLADDEGDLQFEIWGTQMMRTDEAGNEVFNGESEFILEGKVDFGGFVGAYGEESVWVPSYVLESDADFFIPASLRTSTDYRARLMAAAAGTYDGAAVGASDFVKMYENATDFDVPVYEVPTVWTSKASYFGSLYSQDVISTDPNKLDMKFVATGSESSLASMVTELYAARQPFLAYIYTLDVNFGRVDTASPLPEPKPLQQFEKLVFPRNPDQSPDDPCFEDKQCQFPIAPIMKLANPRLAERFPEAHDFFNLFQMTTSQVNLLVSKYLTINDDTGNAAMTSTEKWLHAACEWMKDEKSESTWKAGAWDVAIRRLDCIEGCGFSGVGGDCNFYTGECECWVPELFADTHCTESCPGLVGPLFDEESAEWSFEFCSSHGTCNVKTRQCACDQGYGDAGCGTKYEEYTYTVLMAVVVAFSGLLALVGIACIVWLRMSAEYKTVKALSINMTSIMTVGLIALVCSNIAVAVPVTAASCIAWQWLFGLGGVLAIMSPLLKAYRVSRVFHGGKMLRAVKITDNMLMATLIKAAIAEAALCVGYSFAHQWYGGTETYFNHLELRTEERCNNYFVTSYLSLASYAFFFCILIMLTYYSWGTRRALAVFKESTCAYFSSFLSLLCTLITFTFYMVTDDPAFRIAVQSACITLVIGAVFTLFYATRIYAFFAQPENRNVTDARGASHASTHSVSSVSQAASVMKPGPNAHS